MQQLDEKFDILVSRPIANRIAPPLQRAGFSADQVTFVALASGIAAGLGIAAGGWLSVLGGVMLILMVIIDSTDGAVARLSPPSDKPWRGRMLDGFADLGTLVAVHVGMVIALSQSRIVLRGYAFSTIEVVLIAVVGVISFSWKSSVLDDIKQRLKDYSPDREIEKYRDQPKNLFEKLLWWSFVWYVGNCEKLAGPGRPGGYDLFKLVALVGPSHHLVAIAVCAMFAPLAPTLFLSYFLVTIVPGNLFLWYVLVRARRHEMGGAAIK